MLSTVHQSAVRLMRRPVCAIAAKPWSTAVRAYTAAGDRKYTESHEWISVDNGVGTVGITDYAQELLGDIVFVDLPAAGKKAAQKTSIVALESVKATAEVYAPVDGEVVEVNKKLSDQPELINKGAYSSGWLFKLKVANPSQLSGLLDEAAYKKHVETGKPH